MCTYSTANFSFFFSWSAFLSGVTSHLLGSPTLKKNYLGVIEVDFAGRVPGLPAYAIV